MSNSLREIVRKIQYQKDITVEQVAKSIGYTRVHLTREMKKSEPSDLEGLLMEKHAGVFQNVTQEPQTEYMPTGGLRRTLKDYVENLERHETFMQKVIELSLLDISTNLNGWLKRSADVPATRDAPNGRAARHSVKEGYTDESNPFQNTQEAKNLSEKQDTKHGKRKERKA